MSLNNTYGGSQGQARGVSAFFDNQASAQKAVNDLIAAGVAREMISMTGGQGAAGELGSTASGNQDKGFWDSLKDLFLPDEDRYSYAEGLRRGGYLVAVQADAANYERVLDILDNDGSVNMDERETQWRSEGWTGFTGNEARDAGGLTASGTSGIGMGAGVGGAVGDLTGVTALGGTSTSAAATRTDTLAGRTASSATTAGTEVGGGRDETISLYEERLKIGKREVDHGRVRIRSYVVETPVNEQVSLHDEKVFVDRKAVDRPVTATDAMFQDRVIEAEERVEEAVIGKEARVTEEITLRKTVEDRMQTVSDTVRRTEVEIEDGRTVGTSAAAGQATRFSAATDTSKIVEHMDVISADGQNIGKVDHLDGPNGIKLTRINSPDGKHHHVPFTWIDHVDQHVHLNKTLAAIKAGQ